MTGILNALIAGVSGAVKDTYFNLVSLLLPGNGTNGAQNNTFLDSSGNTFTITRNGNTTQGTFSPFSQTGWGNYFDGSGDYLSTSTSAISSVGSNNFSFECFVYCTRQTNTYAQGLISYGISGSTAGTSYISFQLDASGYLAVAYATANSLTLIDTALFPINQWVHAVVCRSGSTLSLFVNGTRKATTSTSATVGSSGNVLYIGSQWYADETGRQLQGYISNARVLNGTSAYDATSSTLTVPTAPLTAITNTSLLTCQSNRFIDNSTNNFTITRNGNTSVTPFSPFAPTSSYSAAAVGGSGYFDGSGDYLSLASDAALAPQASDFTIEAWLYPTAALSTYNSIYETSVTDGLLFGKVTSGYGIRQVGVADLISATAPAINQWVHVAASRSGTTLRLFINGVLSATVTNSTNFPAGTVTLGAGNAGANPFTGYVSNFRFVKGTAVYTAAFTPPTAPLTATQSANTNGNPSAAITGTATSLLLNFTNAGVVDATAKNVLETVGNAQISNGAGGGKWGGGSILFDGTDDRLTNNNAANPLYAFRTGDFTIEAWVYPTVNTGERGWFQTSDTVGGLKTSYTTGVCMFTSPTPNAYWLVQVGSTAISTTTSVQTNTWTHVAITRTNGSVRVYIGGTLAAGPTSATADLTGQYLVVGGYYSTAYLFNGYIDDLRITNYSRYSGASLTVPTAPFPVQ